jgi:4-carboxymuconolactone decarboxylase
VDDMERGEVVMRGILGDDYWEQRVRSTTAFNQPLRDLSTTAAYANVWSRPGLEPRVRSLLCLGMLTALNRPDELRIHLRGAVNNGCTVDDIRETLLHAAIYCGIPAANDSTRVAEQFLTERGLLP